MHKILALTCTVAALTVLANANMTVTFSINEEMPSGTIVAILSAHKAIQSLADSNGKQKQRFTFTLTKPHPFFSVDESLGAIKTKSRLDRESLCQSLVDTCCHLNNDNNDNNKANQSECFLPLHVLVNPIRVFIQVIINVADINDNVPTFTQSEFTTFVREDEVSGHYCIDLPPAIDSDSKRYAAQDYRLEVPSSTFHLRVNQRPVRKYGDLCLLVTGALDHERISSYSLKVLATDSGLPSRTGTLSVVVRVLDANENSPRFLNDSYSVVVAEDLPVNSLIIQLHASDADEGKHGRVLYSFVPSTFRQDAEMMQHSTIIDRSGPFYLNSETGAITLDSQLDYEDKRFYELRVLARDSGSQSQVPRFSTTSVLVYVTNVNDCKPDVQLFPITVSASANGQLQVFENDAAKTPVGLLVVTDKDNDVQKQNPICTLSSPYFELLPIHDDSFDRFEIVTRTTFDREEVANHYLTLRCEDGGKPSQTVDMSVAVNILDRDDNAPLFTVNETTIYVRENNRIGAKLGKLNFSDADTHADMNDAEFIVTPIDPITSVNVISVRNSTGEVFANVMFDRERREVYQFRVAVRDPKMPQVNSSILLTLLVEDENDETPMFESNVFSFKVPENSLPNTLVGKFKVRDDDDAQNGAIQYTLKHAHSSFTLTEQGELYTVSGLDRETSAGYTLTVVASDNGSPRLSSTAEVRIEVLDKNDNKPMFVWPNEQNNTLYIKYMTPPGVVGHVSAVDGDTNENARLVYSLVQQSQQDDLLDMDSLSGSILLRRMPFPGADRKVIKLVVRVDDKGLPSLHSTAVLTVHFVDSEEDENKALEDSQRILGFDSLSIFMLVGFLVLVSSIFVIAMVSICLRRSRVASRKRSIPIKRSTSHTRNSGFSDSASDRSGSENQLTMRTSTSTLDEMAPMFEGSLSGQSEVDDELTAVHQLKRSATMRQSSSVSNFRPTQTQQYMTQSVHNCKKLEEISISNGSMDSLSSKRSSSTENLSDYMPRKPYKVETCGPSPFISEFMPIRSDNTPPAERPATFSSKRSDVSLPISAMGESELLQLLSARKAIQNTDGACRINMIQAHKQASMITSGNRQTPPNASFV